MIRTGNELQSAMRKKPRHTQWHIEMKLSDRRAITENGKQTMKVIILICLDDSNEGKIISSFHLQYLNSLPSIALCFDIILACIKLK